MKFIFILSLFCFTLHAEVQWKQIGSGAGGETTTIEFDPFDDNIVYMGSDVGGAFRSDDGGKTWKTLMNSILDINALGGVVFTHNFAFDKKRKGTVFMLTTGGLYRSIDYGENWKAVIDKQAIHSNMEFSPHNSKHALCGSGVFIRKNGPGIVFKSKDSGLTWKRIRNTGIPSDAAVRNVAYAPWKRNLVYAATSNGLFKSKDGGENWVAMKSPDEKKNLDFYTIKTLKYKKKKCIVIIARNKVNPKRKNGRGEIFRSFDAGKSWEHITDKLSDMNGGNPRRVAYHMVCNKKTGDLYIPIQKGWRKWYGVWKGSNFGEKWELIAHPDNVLRAFWGGSFAECVAVSEKNPNKMFFGNSQEVYRSEDGGATWFNCGSRIHRGRTYSSVGYEITYPWGLVFDPKNPKRTIAHYQDIGKWNYDYKTDRFTRTRSTHTNKYDGYHGCVQSVILDPANQDHYYLSTGMGYSELRARRPKDYSRKWGKLVKVRREKGKEVYEVLDSANLPKAEPFLAMDFTSPVNSRHLYAAFVDRGIYFSNNAGKSFEKVANDIDGQTFFYRIHCFGKKRPGVYVITSIDRYKKKDAALHRSFDHGKTWELFFDASKYGAPIGVVQHPKNEKVFYVASAYKAAPRKSIGFSEGGGVYMTSDDGKTWHKILAQPYVSAIAIDHNNPKRLMAASTLYSGKRNFEEAKPGIYFSIDSGKNWKLEKKGLGGQLFTFVSFNPFEQNIFYAGTYGAGLHKGEYIMKKR